MLLSDLFESGLDQQAGIGIDGQSFRFSVKDLIALANNYPVSKIDPKQFEEQLAGREEDPSQSMARAQKAELKYPIIVVKRKNGSLWIADGTHRAHKAIMMNLPTIDAKIIPVEDMGQFLVNETIRKVKGGYRLVSKSGKNLGTYPSKSGAEKREKQVQYFKHINEDAKFLGTCVNSFDEDGECIIPNLYQDVSDFAVHEENAIRISFNEFDKNIGKIPNDLDKLISPNRNYLYDEDNKIFMIYDIENDTHYFFKNSNITNEDANSDLAQELLKTKATSYNAIDALMKKIANQHNISANELHDLWVAKYKESPDDWIKDKLNEGPIWDKVKKTAAAGAVAGAAGYGALTGQFSKDEPARAPLEITIPGGDVEQQKPAVKKEKEKLTPSTATNANPELEQLVFLTAYRSGLKGKELAQFMAQVAHETLGFQRLVEVGNSEYFNRYDPEYSPQKAKILGNVKPGDGVRYKGRGFIQITGRDNYKRAGKALGVDLESNPKLASDPKIAARIAVWYWKSRVKPEVKDYTDTIGVTAKINPSMNGLGDRDMNFQHYLQRLDLNENFADGKKPGRKGLAKRMGVNTRASVSSLRKTAKNSTGEKQRMAHWLANMKSGKKK